MRAFVLVAMVARGWVMDMLEAPETPRGGAPGLKMGREKAFLKRFSTILLMFLDPVCQLVWDLHVGWCCRQVLQIAFL